MPDTQHAPRNKFKWLLLTLALTAAMVIIALSACGGDDDDDGGDDAGDETPAATQDGGNGDHATATPADHDDGDGGGDAAAALADFASDYEGFTGMVKYEAKNFSGDAAGFSSMAIYQTEGYSRIDIESADGNVILIDTPDASYMCAENQCLQYPAGDSAGNSLAGLTELFDPGSIEDSFGDLGDDVNIDVSDEEIAGVDATCFSAEGDLDPETPGDESGEVCFAEGGLMLRLTFESGGESGTFEAVEASSDVSQSDFEPPFEVIDLSELGQ